MIIENGSDTQDGQAGNDGAGEKVAGGIDGAVRYVTDALDGAVERASKVLEGENAQKVVGGAAVGALAAIVLPVSIGVGALLGAGYAAYRGTKK